MDQLSGLPALAALFAGITVFFIAYAILAPKVNRVRSAPGTNTEDTLGKYAKPILDEFLPSLPDAGPFKVSENRTKKLDTLMYKAGNPWRINAEEFVGLQIALGTLGALIGAAFAMSGQAAMIPPALLILGFAAGMFFLPLSQYNNARNKRTFDMQKNLPEALDLLTVSLTAGETFQPALASVIKQLPDSIVKTEFQKISLAIQSGIPLEKSLTTFAGITDSEEAESFAKAIIQSQKLGSDVTETLAQQAAFTRDAKETRIEEKIARLSTLLFVPLSLTMLPAFLIIFIAPIVAGLGIGG